MSQNRATSVSCPVRLDLVVVGSPLLARERDRWPGAELVGALEHKGLEVRPGRAGHCRRWNVDPGLRQRTIRIRASGAVMGSRFEYLQSDPLTELLAQCQRRRVAGETLEILRLC